MIEHTLVEPTLDSLPQQLVILSDGGAVLAVNRAWHEFRAQHGDGRAPVGRDYCAMLLTETGVDARERERLRDGIRDLLAGSVTQFRHTFSQSLSGSTYWFEVFAVALPASRGGAVVSQFDVTHDRTVESALRVQANHDALTGLANRRLFQLEAEHSLALAGRRGSSAALIFVDLDGFKAVNDHLGHDAGDDLLVHVAHRLRQETRSSDLLARWGGDEFVMLLHDVDEAEVGATVHRYREALDRPTVVNGRSQRASSSFGAAFFPSHGLTAANLVSQADRAMYADKAERYGRVPSRAASLRAHVGVGALTFDPSGQS